MDDYNRKLDDLNLSDWQRSKANLLRVEMHLQVKKRRNSPLQIAKFILNACNDPTFVFDVEKKYNCTLPLSAQKNLISELIDLCEVEKVGDWYIDDLRTYAKENVLGRKADPQYIILAVKILQNDGRLNEGTWPKGKRNGWVTMAVADALIGRKSIEIELRELTEEIASRIGLRVPDGTYRDWVKIRNNTHHHYHEVKEKYEEEISKRG